jgi:hypothetical protein
LSARRGKHDFQAILTHPWVCHSLGRVCTWTCSVDGTSPLAIPLFYSLHKTNPMFFFFQFRDQCSSSRIVATVEDSVLRTEMAGLESQEEDAPKRILFFKPMSWLGHRVRYHLCLILLVRLGGYIVNLSDFYSYRLIGKLTTFLQLQEFSLRNLPVASSTSAARLFLPCSNHVSHRSLLKTRHYVLILT